MARFVRTRKATDWPADDASKKGFWKRLLFFMPKTNPNYDGLLHLLDSWLIEFPGEEPELPWREIGLDADGVVVLAGPTDQDYGFWLDTNMTFGDFDDAEEVDEGDFERLWVGYFSDNPHLSPFV